MRMMRLASHLFELLGAPSRTAFQSVCHHIRFMTAEPEQRTRSSTQVRDIERPQSVDSITESGKGDCYVIAGGGWDRKAVMANLLIRLVEPKGIEPSTS